jgi:phage shock protein C
MNRYTKQGSRYYAGTRHQKLRSFERGLYRSRHGIILGVFKGLADYYDFSAAWLRIIGVFVFLISGIWPMVVLYLLAALIMKPEPVISLETPDEAEFYSSYSHYREGAVNRMKRKYENLNRRIQRMEDIVTDNAYEWEQRLNS